MSGKYNKLNKYLKNYNFTLSLNEIEKILGEELPRSAYDYKAWWSNSGHEHAKTWTNAGWKVNHVNLGKSITFKIKNS